MTKPCVNPIPFLGAAAVAITATGCSTYEDGPSSSLISKNNRLCREWRIDEYGGVNMTYDITLEFQKDGDVYINQTYSGYSYSYRWNWEWKGDKSGIRISDVADSSTNNTWDFKRLTTDELWFTDDGMEFKCSSLN